VSSIAGEGRARTLPHLPRSLPRPSPSLSAVVVGAVAWEAIGQLARFQFFPPLSAVLGRLVEMTVEGTIIEPLLGSLTNLVLGFGISVIGGVLIGLLMGAYRRVDAALDFWVYALLTAPSLVFAPILFSVFGLGREPIIFIIVLYAMFIIVVNTVSAVRAVPRPLIEMGRSYGASDRQLFSRIILPAALPLIMAGIRLGAGRAVKGMINGEMFIAAVGLGAVVMKAGSRFDSATVLAVLMVIVLVAFALIYAVQAVDRRLTKWLPETHRRTA
jgi:NitT/TauT family transport system permease protein